MPVQPVAESKFIQSPTALLAYAFRPFFLLASAYAMILIVAWMGVWFLAWPLAGQVPTMQWHAHEMLFGMVGAAIAGFLLTAMCNWTGARPLAGPGLAALAALWLVGRVAMWSTAWLPPVMVMLADCGFFLAIALYAGRVIVRAGNHRNLGLVAILALLLVANLLSHLGLWWLGPVWTLTGERLALFLIVLLMVIIGGRITPAFTRNWLKRRGGDPGRIRSHSFIDVISILLVASVALAALIGLHATWVSGLALLAGLANALRLIGWSGWLGRSDPLIWVLHLGYAWVVIGLLIKGAGLFTDTIPDSAWLHALGAGAMGTLILGVMTRVALGHTGRELKLPAFGWLIYAAITISALLRVVTALGWMDGRWPLMLSSAFWVIAFGLFLVLYWPILSRSRVDGRQG